MGVFINESIAALVGACVLTATSAVSIGEATNANIDLNLNVSESITVEEHIGSVAGDLITEIRDSISTSEHTTATTGNLAGNVSDSIATNENVGLNLISFQRDISVFEAIAVGEYKKLRVGIHVDVSDRVVVGITSPYASDSVGIDESVEVQFGIAPVSVEALDSVEISELIDILFSLGGINVSDTITITEDVNTQVEKYHDVEVKESILVGEDSRVTILTLPVNCGYTDYISLQENVSVTISSGSNTTTAIRTGNFITLVFDGNGADFLFSTDATANPGLMMHMIKIISIMWKPDTENDILIIREGSSTGAIIFSEEASSNLQARRKQFVSGAGVRMNPSITVSQCTNLGAGTVTFEIA